jgi:phycoerythrin-associated linker protein
MVYAAMNSGARSGRTLFDESAPMRLWQVHSAAEAETVIRAVYRQVLGNAHVMESERLVVLESQVQRQEISLREFVRQLAKSALYRSRFFDSCSRYRSIELNFKHLLGRAPDSFEEMREHSTILDQGGFEAEIDSYLDSDEYQAVFGESTVPYYRGNKTQPGQSPLEFVNLLKLWRSTSSSDKDLRSGNSARLTQSLIGSRAYNPNQARDASQILAEVFKPKAPTSPTFATFAPPSAAPSSVGEQTLRQQIQEQQQLIATLQQQLKELRPFASIGSAVTQQSQFAGTVEQASVAAGISPVASALERQVAEQQSQITSLQREVAEARSLAAVGEARLSKWRQRTFF